MALSSVLAVLATAWAAFLLAHLLLNGRWWPWLAVSLLPPIALVAVPAGLLACEAFVAGPERGWAALVEVAALGAGLPQSGLNPGALVRRRSGGDRSAGRASAPVRVASWNTQHWNQGGDPEEFYAFLRSLDADVLLLQEYLNGVEGGEVWDIDDEERLRRAFPGHELAVGNTAVTLSRLPLAAAPKPVGDWTLRVDLVMPDSGGRVVSTYNVHIPVQVWLVNPFSRRFFASMRRRAAAREREFQALEADLRANPHDFLAAGDFNTSAAVGDIRRMRAVARDATRANRSAYPVSWNARSRLLRLWRIDWAFTNPSVRVDRYRFLHPGKLSDHHVQDLIVRTVKET
jgi:endonuclease/exonuclease/phosphatase (EEP) superfamily protein YafD